MVKARIHYLYHDYAMAKSYMKQAKQYEDGIMGTPSYVRYCLYDFLITACLLPDMTYTRRLFAQRRLSLIHKKFKKWSAHFAGNFSHHELLMRAEFAAMQNQTKQAAHYYQQAIAEAKKNHFPFSVAIISERAAIFFASHDLSSGANRHLKTAYAICVDWGYSAKARQLKEAYPTYLEMQKTHTAPMENLVEYETANLNHLLDIEAVVEASQAIASQVELKELMVNMIQIMLENAGAQRAVLLLNRENTLLVAAEGDLLSGVAVLHENLPMQKLQLPTRVINYAKHSQQYLLLDNAMHDCQFGHDCYIQRAKPKSVLCMPIIKGDNLRAILYMENKLTSHVFTPKRLKILAILGKQAAISLENALLYENKKQMELSIKKQQLALAQLSQTFTMGETVSNIAHEINQPLTVIVNYIGGCLTRLHNQGISEKIINQMQRAMCHAESIGDTIHQLKTFLSKRLPQKTLININTCIETILQLIGYTLSSAGIKIRLVSRICG